MTYQAARGHECHHRDGSAAANITKSVSPYSSKFAP